MLEKIKQQINKDRWKQVGEYKFDKFIFRTALYLCLGYLFFTAYYYNFDLDYFSCPKDSSGEISGPKIMLKDFKVDNVNGSCKNPFYKAPTWKDEKYLPPGEYGFKPGLLFKLAPYISILLIVISFILNHILNNKGVIEWKKFE